MTHRPLVTLVRQNTFAQRVISQKTVYEKNNKQSKAIFDTSTYSTPSGFDICIQTRKSNCYKTRKNK